MKNMSRAIRRHHQARMYKHVQRKFYYVEDDGRGVSLHKFLCRIRDNVAICSCYMCGNQRRTGNTIADRLTMQERRALLNFKDYE